MHAGHRRRSGIADELWDDRADQDATQLVALLFVAATPLRRVDVAEALRVSPARLARACSVLRADPPRGLRLEESGDHLGLVSAPECTAVLERHLRPPKVEPLSQAGLETLSIVAYEQPVTRADICGIRGVDSDAVVETLLARGLIAEDPRFGGRGRPTFLVTTPIFLRTMGLASLAELPPRPAPARWMSVCQSARGQRMMGYSRRRAAQSTTQCRRTDRVGYKTDIMQRRAEASNSMSVDDYLALEEASDRKHEYVGGEVYALAGASEPHNLIVTNLTVEAALAARRGRQCRVLGSDMRLRVKTDVYYYPDLMVVCDVSDTDPRDKTRPCLVFEVGSPGTTSIDHREKLLAYRGIDSLQAYVIVEQASRSVIVHKRLPDDSWWRDEYHGDGAIELPCPSEFTLTLDQIYAGVLAGPGERRPL